MRISIAPALLLSIVIVAMPAPSSAATGHFATKVTGVTPAGLGVYATATQDGGDITVYSSSGHTVIIDGYQGEPYVRIDRTGVWENKNSPAVYLNQEANIGNIPSGADAHAVPAWTKLDELHQWQWHDHRIHWMSDVLPPAAQADPSHTHLINTWHIPITIDGRRGTITGTLTYVPAGHVTEYLTWGLGAFAALGLGVILVLDRRRRRSDRSGTPSRR